MKNFKMTAIMIFLSAALFSNVLFAQETTIVAPSNEVGENLDLYAVMEVFKESQSVEAFEKALNDPDKNLNNLDLNKDGEIDYIRVVEQGDDEARVFILQAVVGEDLYQDVATIEVEKKNDEEWVAQAIGAEDVYGPNYIVEPAPTTTTVVHVNAWPIVMFVWGAHYVRWHSPYYWRYYPPYYRPRPPYPVHVYRGHVTVYHRNARFHHTTVRRTARTQNIYRTQRGPHKSNVTRTKPVTTQKQPKAAKSVNTKNVNKAGTKTTKSSNVNNNLKNTAGGVGKTPKTAKQGKKTSQTSKATKPVNNNPKTKAPSNSQKKSAVKKTSAKTKKPATVNSGKKTQMKSSQNKTMKKSGSANKPKSQRRPTNNARQGGKRR
ncbi:MAG: hypothetical protein GXO87_10265 [Chlorobi bacterium]|nr:hypothetical protein [Chlorobiota bacterium]